MAIVNESIPGSQGAMDSIPEGEHTATAAAQRSIESQVGMGGGGAPAPRQAEGQTPPPSQPQQPTPPVQPDNQRLYMKSVFPPMPELDKEEPWRRQLRTWAAMPNADAHKRVADLINGQHGPNY